MDPKFLTTLSKREYVIAGVSALVGAAVSAKLSAIKFEAKYGAIAEREIQAAKQFYGAVHKDMTPEEAVNVLINDPAVGDILVNDAAMALIEYAGGRGANLTEVSHNVFTDAEVDTENPFDYEAAARERSPEAPYVISFEEYAQNELEHEQNNLSYFEGDNVLLDDKDVPVDEIESIVGNDNLNRFGDGSGDRNVVYIRNERVSMDFEVTRSGGKASVEVFGFTDDTELQHSARRPRHFNLHEE